MLVHEANLVRKESSTDPKKYGDGKSKQYLAEIRAEYDKWRAANEALVGPTAVPDEADEDTVAQRVQLAATYKDFLDDQKYAEHFHSKSNLHSSVLEQFVYYLFRDLTASFPDDVVGFDPETEESCELAEEREFEHRVSRKTWRCTVCVDSGE